MLALIVWDITKTLLMECFGNRLGKMPDKVKIIPDPTLGQKDRLTHLWRPHTMILVLRVSKMKKQQVLEAF